MPPYTGGNIVHGKVRSRLDFVTRTRFPYAGIPVLIHSRVSALAISVMEDWSIGTRVQV
jgi:hypothetical protein